MPCDSNGVPSPLGRGAGGGMVQWFGHNADEGSLVTITVPTIGHMTYHKRMAEAARQVWIAIDQAGLGHLIDMTDYRASGGTYNNRPVTGGSSPSPHAWGVATDVNTNHIMAHGLEVTVDSNYHCHPDQVADSLKAFSPFFYWWGFSWGGWWPTWLARTRTGTASSTRCTSRPPRSRSPYLRATISPMPSRSSVRALALSPSRPSP